MSAGGEVSLIIDWPLCARCPECSSEQNSSPSPLGLPWGLGAGGHRGNKSKHGHWFVHTHVTGCRCECCAQAEGGGCRGLLPRVCGSLGLLRGLVSQGSEGEPRRSLGGVR